jgi:thioredoxin-dependent peroxiredoxin
MKTTVCTMLVGVLALSCAREGGAPPAASSTPVSAASVSAATGATTNTAATANTTAAASTTTTADLAVGSPPPDFTATAQDGSTVHLAGLKGKPVVVYFYPKDETAGCTKEACSFRDAWDALSKKGVVLVGISADADDSHKAFAAHYKLPFLLVSDKDGAIAASFGVPVHDGHIARQSFVVGPDGLVKKIYRKVDVTVHAQEIMADVTSLP